MNRRKLFIFIGGLLLFCCGITLLISLFSDDEEPEPVAEALPTQMEEIEAVEPTQELEATEVLEPTHTTQPTATDKPTATNTATAVPTHTATATKRPTNTPAPTATLMPQVRITASSVNLRAGPGATYDVVGTAVADELLFVIASNQAGDWYNVVLANNTRAWIASSVVAAVNIFDVLVARTIPAPPVIAATSPPVPTNTTAPLATSTLSPLPTNTSAPLPTHTSAPLPTATEPPSAGVCPCSGDTLNCGDFNTHAAAQACFEYCVAQGAGDIHGLDGNNDGNACESLP